MQKQHVALVEENEQAKKETNKMLNRHAQVSMRARKTIQAYKTDHKSVHALASNMLTLETIADLTGVSVDTLLRRHGKTINRARAETKRRLAHAMHKKAIEEGDGRMQVWLSKQHLGYKEAWPENMQPVAIQINIQDIPA